MPSLISQLTDIVAAAFDAADLDPAYGAVARSDRRDLGQFQCNGALAAAKKQRAKPRDIAEAVAARLRPHEALQGVSIAGPGFINLTLTDAYLVEHGATALADDHLGAGVLAGRPRIVIDYGGPNVAKPMHVGHLRAAIIGESLKRLARFLGADVLGDVHLGDWGLQMGMLIAELREREPDLPYFADGAANGYPSASPVSIADLQELYPAASQRTREDPAAMEAARAATFELQRGHPGYRALWRHFVDVSVAELRRDYERLGVSFDLWLGESDTQDRIADIIQRLRDQGHAHESKGALIMEVAEPGDAKPLPPLMLLKSDGAVLYSTTDIATIDHRVHELHAEAIVYVVDNRQADHFRQVFRGARKAGIAPPSLVLEHAGFGTMNGKDGKPFKTRAGGIMRLQDLMQLVTDKAAERLTEMEVAKDYDQKERDRIAHQVGMATLKYADLMNYRTKDYVFDLDRFSSFEGRTGPYLLYTTVRTKSILRKAAGRGLEPGALLSPTSDPERDVLLKIAEFPDALTSAFEGRAPNHLCEYGYTLAMIYNRFYHDHHILREEDAARQASWLHLADGVVRVMERVLDLLGIEVPERM